METKKFSDMYETEEFIEYYKGARKPELRDRLKTLKSKSQSVTIVRNETRAIITLLA